MRDIFTDGFVNIAVTGTIVRIDLGSLQPPENETDEPKIETNQRLVMPLESFLRSFSIAENVVGKMIEAGVITRAEPTAKPTTNTQ